MKKLEKFKSSKLEKSQFNTIKGGCTSSTWSSCHADGMDDIDPEVTIGPTECF